MDTILLLSIVLIIIIVLNNNVKKIEENYENITMPSNTLQLIYADDNGNMEKYDKNSVFTKGMIIAWHGELNQIPKGWGLCDGSSADIPDLRGRMILGINPSSNRNTALSANSWKKVDGEENVTLKLEQIPPHNHSIKNDNACFKNGGCDDRQTLHPNGGAGATTNNTGGLNGSTQPHNNMPPYYVLAYIIKL